MFDAPAINTKTFRISRENVQLACIVCTLGLGILVIIDYQSKLLRYDQRSSNSLFLAFFIGFFHYSFGSMTWLKSTYQLHGISDFYFDVYTFPVVCFFFTFAVICTKEYPGEFRKTTFAYVVYISIFLLAVLGIGVVRNSSNQPTHDDVMLNTSDKIFNDDLRKSKCGMYADMFTILVLKCYTSCFYYVFEYVFIYATFTAILLWNIQESVLSGKQGQHNQLCISCDSTIRLQQYILMFMMFVIWIVRPTFWIINFYCTLLPQDLIPCMTLCMLYPLLLSYFLYNLVYQEDCLHHRCKQRLYDFHDPKKEEKTLLM
ncbi:uncharacterized protein LOC134694923 [Mytilus trossulus]|uniref:uncharacterized protein LOC134694923 n=1 Tax=Mytilus trossulus TaxID=6551 RepID=UPI0030050E5A